MNHFFVYEIIQMLFFYCLFFLIQLLEAQGSNVSFSHYPTTTYLNTVQIIPLILTSGLELVESDPISGWCSHCGIYKMRPEVTVEEESLSS